MSIDNDLFEAQVAAVAERKVQELLSDKDFAIKYLLDHVKTLEAENAVSAEKAGKWDQFLDADGYLDAGECADHIKVAYIPPNGKPRSMGRNHFIHMLTHDEVLMRTNNGYKLHSTHRNALEGFAKLFTKPVGPNDKLTSSVKFNAKGLNWLHDRYSSDRRIWRSNSAGELYYE